MTKKDPRYCTELPLTALKKVSLFHLRLKALPSLIARWTVLARAQYLAVKMVRQSGWSRKQLCRFFHQQLCRHPELAVHCKHHTCVAVLSNQKTKWIQLPHSLGKVYNKQGRNRWSTQLYDPKGDSPLSRAPCYYTRGGGGGKRRSFC